MGGRHARVPGRGLRGVVSRVALLSFPQAMGLLAAAVVVAILIVGGMLLSGGKPEKIADPSVPPPSTRAAHPHPSPRARSRTANPTTSTYRTLTAVPTPTSAVKSPTPSATTCPPALPPGLKKKQCGRTPHG